MKKYLLLILLFASFNSFAQIYGNEWIKFNQVYYKFPVATNSIFRITDSIIKAVGIPSNVQGQHFQVYRNGVEVPVYTTTDGVFTTNDYIELFAYRANGDHERGLYVFDSTLNPHSALVNDTAFYFLTYDLNNTNNLRYNVANNNIVSPPAKENYCLDTIYRFSRTTFLRGTDNSQPHGYYTSIFDKEGYVIRTITNANDSGLSYALTDAYKLADAPSIRYSTRLLSDGFSTHNLRFGVGGVVFFDTNFVGKQILKIDRTVPVSVLPSNNTIRVRINPYANSSDKIHLAFNLFKYARGFNFGSSNTLQEFWLPAKSSAYYLEINSFSDSAVQPILYDVTNRKRYLGDKTVAGKIRFLLPANVQESYYVLANAKVFKTLSRLDFANFVDYSNTASHGDYLIVTHPNYFTDGSGGNPIEDYRIYRNSNNGGNHIARTVNVNDIYNTFGYGYSHNFLAIQNFLKYAYNNWTIKPKHVFYVGKAINYSNINTYNSHIANNPNAYPYVPVVSYGFPGCDLFFSDFNLDRIPEIPFARFSAYSGLEVREYLNKVKQYEASQKIETLPLNEVLWKKKSLHIAGANSLSEQGPIVSHLNSNANVIKGAKYGSLNRLIKKESTSVVDVVNIGSIDSLLNEGVGLIQFFGHSSSAGLDYGVGEPERYNNVGKYNIFIANGCNAGENIALTANKTIGEKFVSEPQKASIGFLACSTPGFPNNLFNYTDKFYKELNEVDGRSIGIMTRNVDSIMKGQSLPQYLYSEYMGFNGDPALTYTNYSKPDYVLNNQYVSISPSIITTFYDSFEVSFIAFNTAKYTASDSMNLVVSYAVPNSTPSNVYTKIYPKGFAFSDTIKLKIPITKLSPGENLVRISIDNDFQVDELNENNNQIEYKFYIYDDQLVPVYPQNYSIVNNSNLELRAYTSNLFSSLKKYKIQLDTTENFNSPLFKNFETTSIGGVIEWKPNIIMQDSVVYYWRCTYDSAINNTLVWNNSSFIYLPSAGKGWNQSHYYQYKHNTAYGMFMDSVTRKFKFNGTTRTFGAQVCMYGMAPFYTFADFGTNINGVGVSNFTSGAASGNYLQFVMLDSVYGTPIKNDTINGGGLYGSIAPAINMGRYLFFEFPFKTDIQRKVIMDFIDSIKPGNYVSMIPYLNNPNTGSSKNTTFVDAFLSDTAIYGSGNSLYHKLLNQGVSLDSFTFNRPFFVFFKKDGLLSYTPTQIFSTLPNSLLKKSVDFNVSSTGGTIVTNKIGPTNNWQHLYRQFSSQDVSAGDSSLVEIYGVDTLNTETYLGSMYGLDTSLAFIDAQAYPYIKLKFNIFDNVHTTSTVEKYWRVLYSPLPELVLSPNTFFSFRDSLIQGEKHEIKVAVRNVSDVNADSTSMYFGVINSNNYDSNILVKKMQPIQADSFAIASLEFSSLPFSFANKFHLNANYNRVVKENRYDNNRALLPFYISKDIKNPLVDVTFDGVHIMFKELVSAQPFIKIKLKDENKYLKLDDTALITLAISEPKDSLSFNDTFTVIHFDNDTLKFFPASADGKNEAYLEYRPFFTHSGVYKLNIGAKDKTGNIAIKDYNVTFTVDTVQAVSYLLNYPNPFSTSTQFVFTITGATVPDNIRIRIYTPTGKLVREIAKSELGNLHIGKNITDYKWDGTDQFGDKLANGVYFYQFIVSDDNKYLDRNLDITKGMSTGLNKDKKYFKNNFSKLYILR